MKTHQIALIFFLFYLHVNCNSFQNNISKVSLNGSWNFKYIPGGEIPASDIDFFKVDFKEKNWGKINVPSNWELQGKAEPNYAGELKEGIGLYRTEFEAPGNFVNKNIELGTL